MITTFTHTTIDTDTAMRAVGLALQNGADAGIAISVAVVDPAMQLIAFAKAVGATPHSATTSRAKANTAASTRRETGWMGPELDPAIALATVGRLTNILGSVPLSSEGVHVGAIGVAGGTPAQDAEIASATAEELARP